MGVEKIFSSSGASLFVHPVEPVNLPKEVTRFLEIQFPAVTIEPESEQVLYLIFPIEIGIILHTRDEYNLLNVVSRHAPKYSLYGTPEAGVITRLFHSGIHARPPETDPESVGVLRLLIKNTGKTWVEVSRAVFESYFMPIYFGKTVAMSAEMLIFSREIAETQVIEEPLEPEMKPAIQVITARKILRIDTESKRFLMEQGVR